MNRALSLLLSSKGLPVDDMIAALWGKKIYDANEWQITTLTGTLPLSFLSKGEALTDYRIYGSASGAGVETENLYNYLDNTANCYLKSDGTLKTDETGYYTSDFIAVEPGATYTITRTGSARVKGYDGAKQPIRTDTYNDYSFYASTGNTFTVDSDTHYIRFTLTTAFYDSCTLVSGSTAPASYIPYGFKIPLTVTSGVTENKADPDNVEIIALNDKYGVKITGAGTWQVKAFDNVYSYVYARVYNSNNEWVDDSAYIVGSTGTMYSRTLTLNEGDTLCIFDPLSAGTEQNAKDKIIEDKIVAIKSDTAPDHYIPHRYTSDYPVYIGDSKLGAEEYVDFGEQKVWKMVDGMLTPTDPPVSLPAILTYQGENTLSSTETLGECSVTGRIKPAET